VSSNSILLYEDEKGPIVAKTYGGTSWSFIQSKVSNKAQKISGLLNVFGVYDYITIIRCGLMVTERKQKENSF
jgi:hypothetical protein